VPDAPGLELILAGINAEHPGAVLDTSFDREQAALIVDPASIIEVLTWLRDSEGQEYTFLASVHGADYLPAEPRFAVHYELLNRERYERLRVKAILPDPASETNGQSADPTTTFVPPAFGADKYRDPEEARAEQRLAEVAAGVTAPPETVDPTSPANHEANGAVPAETVTPGSPAFDERLPHIASCVELFPTADFQEREVYDFFGIVFDGHPDLRRILMPEDYVGYPQRRDFPIGGEPVIFTRDEVSDPGWWR
jgi:NADH:ubiquinone oxidoreductase subunit C